MGTSQSSGGPGSGVPLVPPWVPAPPPGEASPAAPGGQEGAGEPAVDPALPPATGEPPDPAVAAPPPGFASPGRFMGARRSLGDFARTGSRRDMRRGLGHFVRSGYGGSRTASRRFGGTVATAAALHGALASVAAGQAAAGSPLDPALLAGRSAREVVDAVIEAVRPVDGTQDAEAERAAMRDALSELLTKYPEADLLNLDPEQRAFVIEQFTALDVYRRFELDVGQTIIDKAPSAVAALSRLKEVREYVREVVAASFRKLRDTGRSLVAGRIGQVVRDALHATLLVFEGYAE